MKLEWIDPLPEAAPLDPGNSRFGSGPMFFCNYYLQPAVPLLQQTGTMTDGTRICLAKGNFPTQALRNQVLMPALMTETVDNWPQQGWTPNLQCSDTVLVINNESAMGNHSPVAVAGGLIVLEGVTISSYYQGYEFLPAGYRYRISQIDAQEFAELTADLITKSQQDTLGNTSTALEDFALISVFDASITASLGSLVPAFFDVSKTWGLPRAVMVDQGMLLLGGTFCGGAGVIVGQNYAQSFGGASVVAVKPPACIGVYDRDCGSCRFPFYSFIQAALVPFDGWNINLASASATKINSIGDGSGISLNLPANDVRIINATGSWCELGTTGWEKTFSNAGGDSLTITLGAP